MTLKAISIQEIAGLPTASFNSWDDPTHTYWCLYLLTENNQDQLALAIVNWQVCRIYDADKNNGQDENGNLFLGCIHGLDPQDLAKFLQKNLAKLQEWARCPEKYLENYDPDNSFVSTDNVAINETASWCDSYLDVDWEEKAKTSPMEEMTNLFILSCKENGMVPSDSVEEYLLEILSKAQQVA